MGSLSKAMIGSRIKEARTQAGLKQKDLALNVGVTTQAVSGWERGVTTPSVDMYDPIADLTRHSKQWLFFSVDAPKIDKTKPTTAIYNAPFYRDEKALNGCGCPDYPHYTGETYPLPMSFIGPSIKEEDIAMFALCGDTMSPALPDGSILAIDVKNKSIVDGKMYLVRFGGVLRVKALSVEVSGIKLKNNNQAYDDQIISQESMANGDFEVIGKAFWASSSFL